MRLQGAALKMREAVFRPSGIAHTSDRTVTPELDRIYQQLGSRDAEAELETGRGMTTEEAIEYAFSQVLGFHCQ